MRRGHDNGWLMDGDKVIAVNLGSDFCAEHEWGIEELRSLLNAKENEEDGIERRRIKNPNKEAIRFVEENGEAALLVTRRYSYEKEPRPIKEYTELNFQEYGSKVDKDLATAWSGSDLGIRVRGDKYIRQLKNIYEALINGDAAVWLGGGAVFCNAGLCVGIISNIPEENKKQMLNADLDRKKLMAEHDKIGIRAKIDKLNDEWREAHRGTYNSPPLGYYALSPHWKNGREKTKHKLIYWLNPENQDRTNYGWFTVEQLEQWIEGKGPIPMTKEQILQKSRR